MFRLEYKNLSWWLWLITAVFLSIGVSGFPVGFKLAIGLTIFQLIFFALKLQSMTAFPVQVRFFYLLLLLVALPEPMRWLFWIPAIGTWAQVLVGYCTMARLVSLLPWNRREPLTWRLVWRRFVSLPVRGSVAD